MGYLITLQELASKGIGLVDTGLTSAADRPIELKELCEFWEEELPGVVERWDEFRRKRG